MKRVVALLLAEAALMTVRGDIGAEPPLSVARD